MNRAKIRRILGVLWLIGVGAALYVVLFHRGVIEVRLAAATAASAIAGGAVYLVLGCLRGFTLIPATSLVLVGVMFFPPVPLFMLTLVGIRVVREHLLFFRGAAPR